MTSAQWQSLKKSGQKERMGKSRMEEQGIKRPMEGLSSNPDAKMEWKGPDAQIGTREMEKGRF
eukprot:274905-Prorocentrum_lima.AAC.1